MKVLNVLFHVALVTITAGLIRDADQKELETKTPDEILQSKAWDIFLVIPATIIYCLIFNQTFLVGIGIAAGCVFLFILRYNWHREKFEDGSHAWFRAQHSPDVQRRISRRS